ncbi:MAG TPA: flavin monoamine oxidase family protein [Ktedonobacterales bacterium]|nr:flavin monoamine oxidase family protein [Ktedonobacterales bacterium]
MRRYEEGKAARARRNHTMGVFSRLFGADGAATQSDATASIAGPSERRADVVIVGAGLSGLMAARTLLAASVEPLILEARDRVGGRTWTRPASDGTLLDLGGQWIGPTQRRVLALAGELGVQTFKTYDTGNNIEYRRGERVTYSGAIPTHDPIVSADAVEAMLTLNMMATQVPLDAPWIASNALEWDAQTFDTWIRANARSDEARELMGLVIQAVFSVEARDVSLLHVLFYIHSAGNLMDLVAITGGAQESRCVGGTQQLSEKMAAALGERVILNAPVHTIAQDERGVRVEADGVTISAERAIIALPPTLAGRLRYRPALPGYRDQFTQRIPMGTVIKVQCLYERPFWREDGLTGQVTSDSGAVRITFDNTPPDGSPGILLGFIEGEEGRRWGRRSPEERRAEVLNCLARYFGEQARVPQEYVELSWAEEEYSRGCYAGFLPPGVLTSYGEALRAPIGRLHWAGTETATEWNGYMDGALQAGARAAREILAGLE